MTGKACSVRVVARFRPLSQREQSAPPPDDAVEFSYTEDSVCLDGDSLNGYSFDRVYNPGVEQEQIYRESIASTIDDVLQGINGTVCAYGQTGSGKTYTMFGPDSFLEKPELQGMIPRAAEHLFREIDVSSEVQADGGSTSEESDEFSVACEYYEVYNERVNDLLDPSKENLSIRESPEHGVYVEGASSEFASSVQDVLDLLAIGVQNRRSAATRMNERSSRSHSIFRIIFGRRSNRNTLRSGMLNLVDLAGSEKVKKTGAQGSVLREAQSINTSLSALGKCIHALSLSTNRARHVPYRDSKLTRILQDSLGGNTKTTLVLACSPHHSNLDETIGTLRFGQRAKLIKTEVRANIQRSIPELERIVALQTEELALLRKQCKVQDMELTWRRRPSYTPGSPLPESLQEELRQVESQLDLHSDKPGESTSSQKASEEESREVFPSSSNLHSVLEEKSRELQHLREQLRVETARYESLAATSERNVAKRDEALRLLEVRDATITELENGLAKASEEKAALSLELESMTDIAESMMQEVETLSARQEERGGDGRGGLDAVAESYTDTLVAATPDRVESQERELRDAKEEAKSLVLQVQKLTADLDRSQRALQNRTDQLEAAHKVTKASDAAVDVLQSRVNELSSALAERDRVATSLEKLLQQMRSDAESEMDVMRKKVHELQAELETVGAAAARKIEGAGTAEGPVRFRWQHQGEEHHQSILESYREKINFGQHLLRKTGRLQEFFRSRFASQPASPQQATSTEPVQEANLTPRALRKRRSMIATLSDGATVAAQAALAANAARRRGSIVEGLGELQLG